MQVGARSAGVGVAVLGGMRRPRSARMAGRRLHVSGATSATKEAVLVMPDHSATDTPGGTASERRDEAAPVRAERARRDAMWAALLNAGGPDSVPPSVLRELPIYGRQQGILGDLTRTKDVAPGGAGVAAALLHTGRHYADELDDDGLRYHYPVTGRLGQRDANEVEAKRNACRLGIPVFVITQPTHATRSVRRAWVASWDDEQAAFLVSFGEQPTAAPQPADDAEFVLEQKAPAAPASHVASPMRGGGVTRRRGCPSWPGWSRTLHPETPERGQPRGEPVWPSTPRST